MKVYVITPTWKRHDLLLTRCIPSVAQQTYPYIEHIIISDGPDPDLRTKLETMEVVYTELGVHTKGTSESPNVGALARNRGLEFVTDANSLVAYLDDDNAFRPTHIELLVAAMTNSDADFGYSRMFRYGIGDVIGSDPPGHGTIDSSIIIHRHNSHLRYGNWPHPASYSVDWDLINLWLVQGATWIHVPEVTVDYYYKGTN